MFARVFDLFLALFGLLLFAPAFLLIALGIFVDDRRPIFFRQERLGFKRRLFQIYKFRTMRNGKVTRVGAWLRQSGLDEIAQFLNVIRGEMSIVGPRPLTPMDVDRLGWKNSSYSDRWEASPGITGFPQVFGVTSARHSLKLDRLYIRRQSRLLIVELTLISFLMNGFGKRRVRRHLKSLRRLRCRLRSKLPPNLVFGSSHVTLYPS